MGHLPLLDELAIIAALSVVVTVILSRLKLPTVAGLLAAGALLGPFGLGLVTSIKSIEVLAEIGVVLLLFSIGLEFSLSRLQNILRKVALGGALQVGLTIMVTAGIAVALGQSLRTGVFYGFVFALSSTAIVLRALAERRELDAPHGRIIVGTLIFQDLCVVPMVLVVPLLGQSGGAGGAAMGIGIAMAKAVAVVVGTITVSRLVVPKVLAWVDASRSREVFLLAILALCIGTAWLTSLAGLSLALGAFLGGMVVADTEYGHRAMGDILPLKDAFVSVFFVSLGMLFDTHHVLAHPMLVAALLLGFLLGKGLIATAAALAARFPARVAWLAGVSIAQFGEFGFVLARMAESHGVITPDATATLLAAGIASMFLTPLLVRSAPLMLIGERLLAPVERLIGARAAEDDDETLTALRDHVVIVGYGLAGRYAASTLAATQTPFVVLDLNASAVREAKLQRIPVYYADATSAEALAHAHLPHACLLVLLMNDPQAAERVVDTARRVAPDVPILMRTRYLAERDKLARIGARDIVAEEVEGAMEIISRMLRWVETPRNVIDARLNDIRVQTQTSDRTRTIPRLLVGETRALDEMKIESALVQPDSVAAGASPLGLKLQSETGALVVGIRRNESLLEKVDPSLEFAAGDVVYLVGTSAAIRRAVLLFEVA